MITKEESNRRYREKNKEKLKEDKEFEEAIRTYRIELNGGYDL